MSIRRGIDWLIAHRIKRGPSRGLLMCRTKRCAAFASGEYETPVQELIETALSPGNVFLDVGANIGFFSILAARLVGDQGAVYAFEPIAGNIAEITRNIAINGLRNVLVIPRAVTESTGVESIWLTDHPGGATLTSVGEVPLDARIRIEIPTVSLDSWTEQNNPRSIRLIKIDVEGAELQALRGMRMMLERFRPMVLIELDDLNAPALARKALVVSEWMRVCGYVTRKMPDSYSGSTYNVTHLLATSES